MPMRRSAAGSNNHRDLPVLDGIREAKNVSQRTLAGRLGIAPSQVNRCLRELLEAGMIRVVNPSVRPFAYRLTPQGEAYRQTLVHRRFDAVVGSLQEMRDHIRRRLREIKGKGMGRLVFYGSGEVMETTLPLAEGLGLEVVGVVDDDPKKQGDGGGERPVHPPSAIAALAPDAVLITTFRHAGEIRERMAGGPLPGVPVLEL